MVLLDTGTGSGLLEVRVRSKAAESPVVMWEDGHYSSSGLTHVVVRKIARLPSGAERELESQTIASIPDGACDWRARFDAARIAAYDRAISLNQPTLH